VTRPKRLPKYYFLVQSNKTPPLRAVVLQHALKAIGYDAPAFERPELPSDFAQLSVSSRETTEPPSTPLVVQSGRDVNIYQAPLARVLTKDQAAKLLQILKGEPNGTVEVVCVSGNEDSENCARQFSGILQAVGWKVQLIYGAGFSYGTPKGLTVRAPRLDVPRAVALRKALSAIGLQVESAENPKISEDRVILVVGLR
jgi:hypothetical protein